MDLPIQTGIISAKPTLWVAIMLTLSGCTGNYGGIAFDRNPETNICAVALAKNESATRSPAARLIPHATVKVPIEDHLIVEILKDQWTAEVESLKKEIPSPAPPKLVRTSPKAYRVSQPGTYKVTEPGISLSLISTVIYGTSKRWQEIAAWNQLEDPYRIYLGQVLILKETSHSTPAQMAARLKKVRETKLAKADAKRLAAAAYQAPSRAERSLSGIKKSVDPRATATPLQPASRADHAVPGVPADGVPQNHPVLNHSIDRDERAD